MSEEEIRAKINKTMPSIKAKYHIKQLGIFGSFVRNEQTEESDVDILVEFDSPIGFFDFVRLERQLSETLNKKVDLVSKKALKSAIREEVLKEIKYV